MDELSYFSQGGVIDAADSVMKEAYLSLIDSGKTPKDADLTVKKNFERVNNNPLLLLNIKELCKSI